MKMSTTVLSVLDTFFPKKKKDSNFFPPKNLFTHTLYFLLFRNFEHLIPDAPELIHDFLVNEKDASCKRNAFMMLIHADQVKVHL